MNYYEHHLGDYVRDTAHLSMIEDGAYRRLLDAYYIRERLLPADMREVYRLARAQSKQDRDAIDVVLKEFFQKSDDGWLHKRCESEIERYRESQVDREASKGNAKERQRRARERRRDLFEALRERGIVPAYDTPTSQLHSLLSRATSQPVTRDVTCDDTVSHTPVTNIPPKPPKGGAVVFPPGFEKFWAAYPRKDAKAQAMKAFAKLRADEVLLASILRGVAAARDSEQWQRDGGKFVPYAATWLNGRRWEDEAVQTARDPFRGAL